MEKLNQQFSQWEESEEALIVESRPSATPWLSRVTAPVMLVLLVGLPLSFGGRGILPVSIAKLLMLGLLAVYLIQNAAGPVLDNSAALRIRDLFQRMLVGLGLLCVVQMLPLPVFVLNWLSPRTAELYGLSGAWVGRLSLEGALTLSDFSWLLVMLAFGWMLIARPSRPHRAVVSLHRKHSRRRNQQFEDARLMDGKADFIQRAIVLSGGVFAAIAMTHWVMGSEALFGLFAPGRVSTNPARAHWPFVNPNSLSFFLQIAGLTAFARLLRLVQLYEIRRSREENSDFFLLLVRKPETMAKKVLYLATLVLIVLANVLTFSKAGNALMLVGMSLIWLAYRRIPVRAKLRSVGARERRTDSGLAFERVLQQLSRFKGALLLAGGLSFLLIFIGDAGRDFAAKRLEYGLISNANNLRWEFFKASLQVFGSFPIFGVGLGCWSLAAQAFLPDSLAGWKLDYAHNDLFQYLAETGIFGAAILGLFLLGLFQEVTRFWRKQLRPTARFQWLAAGISFFVPLLHAFFDFPLHIPGAAFVALLALVAFIRLQLFEEQLGN